MMARRQRTLWTLEEDNKLREFQNKYPDKSWEFIAMEAGLNKDRKSCQYRWQNYLRPGIHRGPFTEEDNNTIIDLHAQGKGWAFIGKQLKLERAENDVKNYWNNYLKKKVEIRDLKIREMKQHFLTDDGPSDHSVPEDDVERLMANLASSPQR